MPPKVAGHSANLGRGWNMPRRSRQSNPAHRPVCFVIWAQSEQNISNMVQN